ncbi:MAG TPA: hydrogenase maturation protease [Desulfobulbaceae bacterium]|nr:hydrogenase maturation protease [Desulfobulbaceae bacterium]
MPSDAAENTLILGVGNLILRDEGVGIHVVHALEAGTAGDLPPQAHTLDGGTGGFHLIGRMQEYQHVIMIDATLDDQPPGTVTVIEPRHAADFPPLLSAHEVGLRDMIEAMALSGNVPRIHLITVSAADVSEVGMELTPAVQAAIPEVIAKVKALLDGKMV